MKPEARERLVQAVPLRRLGEAEHIARSVAFIFETDYFTGRCIDMDGGCDKRPQRRRCEHELCEL